MYNILVTGVGSNIGQGIIKSLKMSPYKCKIIGTDMHPLSAGLYRCDKSYLVPPAKDKGFTAKLIEICVNENIDALLIGSDAEIIEFARNKGTIERKSRAKVIVSPLKLVETVSDKLQLAGFLQKECLNFPVSALGKDKKKVQQLIDLYGFPIFVKPRRGSGSRGASIVKNQDELTYVMSHVPELIVQEILGSPEEEYTAGLFFSRDSILKGSVIMKRELSFGTTYRAIADDYPEINKEVARAAKSLSSLGAVGSINIQLRLTNRGAVIFEINPRFSGTTSFRANLGFNEAEALVKNYLLGDEIPDLIPNKGVMMRYWNEIYTSFDEIKKITLTGSLEQPQSENPNLL
jgi:carbamoyl-phosphate synthase large subunit